MSSQNCWEIKNCGRQVNGPRAGEAGVCPAALESSLNGVHGGKNAGRACWVIEKTLCENEIQGHFGSKFARCQVCDVYKNVKADARGSFVLSATLLAKMKK